MCTASACLKSQVVIATSFKFQICTQKTPQANTKADQSILRRYIHRSHPLLRLQPSHSSIQCSIDRIEASILEIVLEATTVKGTSSISRCIPPLFLTGSSQYLAMVAKLASSSTDPHTVC